MYKNTNTKTTQNLQINLHCKLIIHSIYPPIHVSINLGTFVGGTHRYTTLSFVYTLH